MAVARIVESDRGLPGARPGLPVVSLVGRANVGKSTLFNRITRRGRAIVSAIPGTTRDLNVLVAEHQERRFAVVDSGGLELGGREGLSERVVSGALKAVAAADVVLFVVDGRAGLSAADAEARPNVLLRAARETMRGNQPLARSKYPGPAPYNTIVRTYRKSAGNSRWGNKATAFHIT